MVRYILGQSSEEERAQVEERYFSDGEYFDQLLAVEDSLIDDFVAGRMPAERLVAFKESLSGREDDIRFSRALFRAVTKKQLDQLVPEAERPLLAQRSRVARTTSFRAALLIAPVILLALSLALALISWTLRNRLSETEAQLDALAKDREATEQELSRALSQIESSAREMEIERNKRIDVESLLQKNGRAGSANVSSDFRTIVLGSAFITRGAKGATREVRLSQNVRWLRLAVSVDPYRKYDAYRISMKRAGESAFFESAPMNPPGGSHKLAITIPAKDLKPGDYIVALYGEGPASTRTELEQYSLRITD